MIKIFNVPSLKSALKQTERFCLSNKDEEVLIVVPDKFSLFMEQYIFNKLNLESSFNIKVVTLNRLAKRNANIDVNKQISNMGSIILTHKVLNDNLDKLQVLKSKAYSFGYAEEIFKTISQLKSSKITPQEMEKYSSKNEQLQDKIHDIALIYSEYENGKAGLLDNTDSYSLCAMFVGEEYKDKQILFVGYEDFTAIEYQIIEQLAQNNNLYFCNYFANSNNKQIYSSEVLNQLKGIANIININYEVENCDVYDNSIFGYLEQNLFSANDSKFLLNDVNVLLIGENSIDAELEYIARDIRRKIINGAKYSDFGVAVFGLDGVANKVKNIFEKYELHTYIDGKINLSSSVYYKFLNSVFKYNVEVDSLIHLIDLINSPFCNINEETKHKIVQKLVNINYRGKILSNIELGDDLKDEEKLLNNFVQIVTLNKEIEIKDIINWLKELDDALKISDILANLAEKSCVESRILLSKSKESIDTIFVEIAKFYNTARLKEIFDIFLHLGEVAQINNLPLSLDCIKVVEANDFKEQFDDLYFANCTASNAPMLKYDCGIILDDEIEKLNFAHKLSPTIAHINKLAKLKLFNSVLMFNKNLSICFSNIASDLIKELKNRLQVNTKELGVIDMEILGHIDSLKYLAYSKWDYIEAICKANKSQDLLDLIKVKKIDTLSLKGAKEIGNIKTISASQLENYFDCPFYYFVNNQLKIQPRLSNDILSVDIGNILHEILYVYYTKNKQVGDIYAFCKNMVMSISEKDERLQNNLTSPILINLIDEAVRVIFGMDYIDKNTLFVPTKFELPFVGEKVLKLNNIDVVGKIDRIDEYKDKLRIIDYKSGKSNASLKELYYGIKLQLFLYACAVESNFKKQVVGGFYLPLHNEYSREVCNTYAMKGFYENTEENICAFDVRLQPNTTSDIVNVRTTSKNLAYRDNGYKALSFEEFASLKNYAKEVSQVAVDEIKSGYIKPSPSAVSSPCEYCPYAHICLHASRDVKMRESGKINLTSFNGGKSEKVC